MRRLSSLLGLVLAPLMFVTLPAIVTAAVTFTGAGLGVANADLGKQMSYATYVVQITNLQSGNEFKWTRKTWDTENGCDDAIAGLTDTLNSIAALKESTDGDGWVGDIVGAPLADRDLVGDLAAAIEAIMSNTAAVPHLAITCKLLGDPA